jgi:hypothetical protein
MYKSNHHPCIHEFEEENNLNQITTAKKKKDSRNVYSLAAFQFGRNGSDGVTQLGVARSRAARGSGGAAHGSRDGAARSRVARAHRCTWRRLGAGQRARSAAHDLPATHRRWVLPGPMTPLSSIHVIAVYDWNFSMRTKGLESNIVHSEPSDRKSASSFFPYGIASHPRTPKTQFDRRCRGELADRHTSLSTQTARASLHGGEQSSQARHAFSLVSSHVASLINGGR